MKALWGELLDFYGPVVLWSSFILGLVAGVLLDGGKPEEAAIAMLLAMFLLLGKFMWRMLR